MTARLHKFVTDFEALQQAVVQSKAVTQVRVVIKNALHFVTKASPEGAERVTAAVNLRGVLVNIASFGNGLETVRAHSKFLTEVANAL